MRQLLPSLAVAFAGAAWGLYWIPVAHFERAGLDGIWIGIAVFALSLVVLLPIIVRRWRHQAGRRIGLVVNGGLLGLGFTLYSASLMLTDVVHAILLFYVTPVWSTLLGAMLLGERVTWLRLLALGLGLAGLFMVLDQGTGIPMPRNLGDWFSLVASVLWAYGNIRLYADEASTASDTMIGMSAGGLAASLMLLALPVGASATIPWRELADALPLLAALTVVGFVPSSYLMLWGARFISPGRVGILLMTEVVVGTTSAALLAGDAFGWREGGGMALILAAGLVEVLGRAAPPPPRVHEGA